MHANSRRLMNYLLEKYACPAAGKTVIDVGSRNVNGTYRDFIEQAGYDCYLGIDIEDGPNVDVVLPESGDWQLEQADVVISGQCLEHVRQPWTWIRQVATLVKPGGTLIVIAPWSWPIHRHPLDCWRILPDGLQALLEWADLHVLAIGVSQKDCYGVGRKV